VTSIVPAKKDERDWVGPLLKMAGLRNPREKRGRKKALRTEKVTDPEQRTVQNLLREIGKISAEKPSIKYRTEIARGLFRRWPSKYGHLKESALRHEVGFVLAKLGSILKRTPPDHWPLGVQPPTEMTKQALFEKSLEVLRKKVGKQ
jgi:hypothetical protein